MIILTIRSDNPEAEVGLFDDEQELTYEKWEAHRELSQTVHKKIETLLKSNNLDWKNLDGIVCFKGPGSFTGLRIGLTVGNTLAFSIEIPIVGSEGKEWIKQGIHKLQKGDNDSIVMPEYGAEAHITKPRK